MDLALLVYVISVIANIKVPLIVGTILFGILFVIASIVKMIHLVPSDYDRKYNMESFQEVKAAIEPWWKKLGILFVVISIFNIITPAEKTMYVMVGAYAAQKVAENEKVVVLSSKVLKIIESKLDGYIDEAEQEVKKKLEATEKKAVDTATKVAK